MDSEEFENLKRLVDQANRLARRFYAALGYEVKDNYAFYNATHPQEQSMWDMAVIAFTELNDHDIEEILEEYLDELRSRTDPQDAAREARINDDL